jgi:hypothetical protein
MGHLQSAHSAFIFPNSADTDKVLAVLEESNLFALAFVDRSDAIGRGLRYFFFIPDIVGSKRLLTLDDKRGSIVVHLHPDSGYLLARAIHLPGDEPVYIHREAGNVVILKTLDGTVMGRDAYGRLSVGKTIPTSATFYAFVNDLCPNPGNSRPMTPHDVGTPVIMPTPPRWESMGDSPRNTHRRTRFPSVDWGAILPTPQPQAQRWRSTKDHPWIRQRPVHTGSWNARPIHVNNTLGPDGMPIDDGPGSPSF